MRINQLGRVWSCILGAAVLCGSAMAADVAAIGDSMMKPVGKALRKQLGARNVTVEELTSIGSGLARLDLMDWHAKASSLMAEHHPATVFVMMGANDNQAMQVGDGVLPFGSVGWGVEYGRRAGKLMDILVEGGAQRVVWVGLPVMREQKLDADVRVMEKIVLKQAEARVQVAFFPVAGLLSPPGEYKAYIILDSGMPLDIRAEDGIHLNRNGAEHLAHLLLEKFLPLDSK